METPQITPIVQGRVDAFAFEPALRTATKELSSVLAATIRTQSRLVESTHFLMVLADVLHGVTLSGLAARGLSPDQWKSGLEDSAARHPGGAPVLSLTSSVLDESATKMLAAAAQTAKSIGLSVITEPVLLHAGLKHLTKPVEQLCEAAGIDVGHWIAELEGTWKPATSLPVFSGAAPSAAVEWKSFSPGGTAVLKLMQREAEALGADIMDARHLLLALITHEGGAMHYGLHLQSIPARRIQQALMLSLRARPGAGRNRLPLEMAKVQPLVRQVLDHAATTGGRSSKPKIAEPHILLGFLAVDSTARRILTQQGVDLIRLEQNARDFEPDEVDEAASDSSTMADVDTIEKRLKQRVVGQDAAVDRILPHIQRMRFGFSNPNRPVGVFLFCGQSGSGKTEMAKELARAVYGSEENLLFLEMGQFNSRESMNIFVGAAPGYVGYGEGKLTNGLRDKPRAVVLFDEVEKADPRVLDALLRFLDEGKITDPAGPVRDGTQCLVILTSNVGAEALSLLWREVEKAPNARAIIRKRLREEFKKHDFRVEFLNRVDELLLFRTLDGNDYTEIARRLLDRETTRLQEKHGITVVPDKSVAEQIGSYCAGIGEGARAAQRLVQSVVVTPVIDHVVRHALPRPVRLQVRAYRDVADAECEPEGIVET